MKAQGIRHHKLHVPAIPAWLSTLNSNSLLNTRDVAGIFGYSGASVLLDAVSKGAFPAPAEKVRFNNPCVKRNKNTGTKPASVRNFWTKAEILKEIQRRQALATTTE